jgi:hypothetical protein
MCFSVFVRVCVRARVRPCVCVCVCARACICVCDLRGIYRDRVGVPLEEAVRGKRGEGSPLRGVRGLDSLVATMVLACVRVCVCARAR